MSRPQNPEIPTPKTDEICAAALDRVVAIGGLSLVPLGVTAATFAAAKTEVERLRRIEAAARSVVEADHAMGAATDPGDWEPEARLARAIDALAEVLS